MYQHTVESNCRLRTVEIGCQTDARGTDLGQETHRFSDKFIEADRLEFGIGQFDDIRVTFDEAA